MGGGGTRYIIINKDRLILASALYVPHESFFHQGQKHTILNFIRGILNMGGGAYAPYDWLGSLYKEKSELFEMYTYIEGGLKDFHCVAQNAALFVSLLKKLFCIF